MSVRVVVLLAALLGARGAAAGEVGIPAGGEAGHPVHVTLDATATYGIGAYSAVGAQLHPVVQVTGWNVRRATGSIDFGLVFGVQDEPQALQYGAVLGQRNDAQRLNVWVTVGHTFHLGARRRLGFGFHLFNGWTHVWSQASFDAPAHRVVGHLSDDYGKFNTGGMLKLDYRFSKWVGLSVQMVGPWPVGPSYVTTLFHVGIGITGYLR